MTQIHLSVKKDRVILAHAAKRYKRMEVKKDHWGGHSDFREVAESTEDFLY